MKCLAGTGVLVVLAAYAAGPMPNFAHAQVPAAPVFPIEPVSAAVLAGVSQQGPAVAAVALVAAEAGPPLAASVPSPEPVRLLAYDLVGL